MKELDQKQEITRSINKTYRSKLWSKFIKAIKDFNLISENDHIAVCVSGGKDSMLMAKLFSELVKYSDFSFKVTNLVMDPGYNPEVLAKIKANLELFELDYTICNTNIFEVVDKQEKNHCFLCARMRRGALYNNAKSLGCNKIALGHHYNDIIETTLMNMLNSGSIQTMVPKLVSENYPDMELIRPMYYIKEEDILRFVKHNHLEFVSCSCPLDELIKSEHESKRKKTKELIAELKKVYNENVEENLFSSTNNVNLNMILGYKQNNIYHNYYDDYEEVKKKNGKE